MTPVKEETYTRIKRALASAYHEKERAEVGHEWKTAAMRRIRNLRPSKSRTIYLQLFEPFVWRLAPAACALILLLAVAFFQMDFTSEYEMAKIFFEDPTDFSLFQQNGVG